MSIHQARRGIMAKQTVSASRTPDEALTGPSDDFTEGSDTALTSHTPTGSNAGTGPWTRFSSSDNAQVKAATDLVQENGSGASNRYALTDNLGTESMDVYGEFTTTGSASSVVFWGLGGLLDPFTALGVTSQMGLTFIYSFNDNKWRLEDDIGGGTSLLAEAWPGGTVPMFLRIRAGDASGWAKISGVWVEKVQLTTWTATGTRAGLILGNFTGVANKSTCDNYRSQAR